MLTTGTLCSVSSRELGGSAMQSGHACYLEGGAGIGTPICFLRCWKLPVGTAMGKETALGLCLDKASQKLCLPYFSGVFMKHQEAGGAILGQH
jgi:hypothetical protein